jgi:hypothetical protein
MSFLYPRVVSIRRPATQTSVGAVGYSGETKALETTIATNLPASIQHRSGRGTHRDELPADPSNKAAWYIFIPKQYASLGLITERDIVVDDLGKRYQVSAAYFSSLGYRLYGELLQV